MALANFIQEGFNAVVATGIPVGIANTGSVAANGALTLGTALAATYPNIWLFLPAGAAFAASPSGFYFCQMSSTTLGTIFNNVLVANQVPYIPAVPTPIVAAGPGAYTGATTVQTAFNVNLPTNALGPNGVLRATLLASVNNTAGVKTITAALGGTTIYTTAPTTSTNVTAQATVFCRGVANGQVSQPTGVAGPSGAATGSVVYSTVTYNALTTPAITVTLQVAVATDVAILEGVLVEALYNQ